MTLSSWDNLTLSSSLPTPVSGTVITSGVLYEMIAIVHDSNHNTHLLNFGLVYADSSATITSGIINVTIPFNPSPRQSGTTLSYYTLHYDRNHNNIGVYLNGSTVSGTLYFRVISG